MIGKLENVKPRSVGPADVDLGGLIRERRRALNMSQQELGKNLGISFQQIQKYENGINRVNANRLAEIAKIIKMRTEEFYTASDLATDVSSLIDVDDKGTVRMLRAYARIKDHATQRQMVVLIEMIADASNAISV